MDFFQNNAITNKNNSFNLQNSFFNKVSGTSYGKNTSGKEAYYAKKGEPMYMKEMDSDEDGIVSFDEFKEYCQANGISSREMVKMVEMANSYRTMQAQKRAETNNKSFPNIEDKVELSEEAVYATRGDGKYDEVMDTNSDDKVTYKEYMEYCKEHSKDSKTQKSDDKTEETEETEETND